MGNDKRNYADLTAFNEKNGAIEDLGKVECWAVTEQEDQPVSGITFALENADLTVSDETLAAMGYVKA